MKLIVLLLVATMTCIVGGCSTHKVRNVSTVPEAPASPTSLALVHIEELNRDGCVRFSVTAERDIAPAAYSVRWLPLQVRFTGVRDGAEYGFRPNENTLIQYTESMFLESMPLAAADEVRERVCFSGYTFADAAGRTPRKGDVLRWTIDGVIHAPGRSGDRSDFGPVVAIARGHGTVVVD